MIFLALLAGGFFRSLQMTSINTLSYADVPSAMLSRATSLTSMAQQLSQSVGVGTGALLLYLTIGAHGTAAPSARRCRNPIGWCAPISARSGSTASTCRTC